MTEPRRVALPPHRALLIFDGDCGFCRFWIARWRQRTGDAVDVQPAHDPDLAARFPEIARSQTAAAVQLVEADGAWTAGAAAIFRMQRLGGRAWPLWLYDHVPGFAPITELAYRTIANHRALAARVTNILWGRTPERSSYAGTAWLFLRALGLIYLAAFWSLSVQIVGLIGHDGILPAERYMTAAHSLTGMERLTLLPTLTWFSASDAFLRGLCYAGMALAGLLIVGVLPFVVVPLLWLLYLSLSVVGVEFLSYQWDALLLEAGLLAVLLAPWTARERFRELRDPPRIAVWLFLWLAFRLMLGSGLVKLTSGDQTWRDLTALTYHFETQPIPTPLAWYAHQAPLALSKIETVLVFIVEIAVPFLMFAPRRLRAWSFIPLAGLQTAIALTGNYAFFNGLTVALCLFVVDDAALGEWAVTRRVQMGMSRARRAVLIVAAAVIVPVSAMTFAASFGTTLPGSALVEPIAALVAPLRSFNAYGLFAVMTTTRPEIVVEGSDDGTEWREYEFKYKAGDLARRPPWVAPHQPRLDWQMWFAALGRFDSEPWFQEFCARLLEGRAPVLALLARDPFGGRPPRYVRATLYQYHFADRAASQRDGVWWVRERLGPYSPTLSLTQ